MFQINNTWQSKFIHGKNYASLDPRRIDNVNPQQRGLEVSFDVSRAITGNGRYCFAIESRIEENLRIAGRLHKIGDESRLDVRFKAPFESWLHETVDDYRGYLRFGMPERGKLGNIAAIRFDVRNIPAGKIRRAEFRLQSLANMSEVKLFRLATVDWEEAPESAKAITGEKLNRWFPMNDRVPIRVAREVRKGDSIVFDVTDVIAREGVYAFVVSSDDKAAAVSCRETLPTTNTGPELILDIEPPATNTTSFKKGAFVGPQTRAGQSLAD